VKLERVNNWFAADVNVFWNEIERSVFAKPLITDGTATCLPSLLWCQSPAFQVPGPTQLPGGARFLLSQWPLDWNVGLHNDNNNLILLGLLLWWQLLLLVVVVVVATVVVIIAISRYYNNYSSSLLVLFDWVLFLLQILQWTELFTRNSSVTP